MLTARLEVVVSSPGFASFFVVAGVVTSSFGCDGVLFVGFNAFVEAFSSFNLGASVDVDSGLIAPSVGCDEVTIK